MDDHEVRVRALIGQLEKNAKGVAKAEATAAVDAGMHQLLQETKQRVDQHVQIAVETLVAAQVQERPAAIASDIRKEMMTMFKLRGRPFGRRVTLARAREVARQAMKQRAEERAQSLGKKQHDCLDK